MDYYYVLPSSPCRGPLLTARALGLELNLKVLDIQKKEQLKPEFVAINPQHCVPTLVDGDLKLWESRAICCYLANQYGKDDSLYPREARARATVDRMLYFDMGTLYQRFGDYVYPVLFKQVKPDPEKLAKLQEALGFLDTALKGSQFVAGSSVTVADHTLVATVATLAATGISLSGHPNVSGWLARCSETLPGYEENKTGAQQFADYVKPKVEAALKL